MYSDCIGNFVMQNGAQYLFVRRDGASSWSAAVQLQARSAVVRKLSVSGKRRRGTIGQEVRSQR